MKALTLNLIILSMGLIFSVRSNAQSDQYASAMKSSLEKMSTQVESFQSLSAAFERIALAEKTQWLPYYYAAYASINQSFGLTVAEERDKVLDQAQKFLEEAAKLKSDSSECMALQGFLYVARIQVDPMGRGGEYVLKANEAFDKAISLNPKNPRGYYLKGITVMNTPDFLGGGKEPAKPILTLAMTKFETFKPSSPLSPNWGKEDCKKQIAACE
jgi:tetratricopeptide (TPR) repeat protein